MSPTGFSQRFIAPLIGSLISFGYKKWSQSWQWDVEDIGRLDDLLDNGESVILVTWHGKFIPLIAMLEGHDIAILTSDSFRGEVISQICKWLGYKPSLIPSGGQGNAYRHFRKTIKSAKLGAFAVDGPLGPNHQAKPGAIKLASNFGHLIVPISTACDRKWVMKRRWDAREIPFWGSRVSLAVGDPIRVPNGLRSQELTQWNDKVTAAIKDVDRRAGARAENPKL